MAQTKTNIRIVLADDYPMFREGIRLLLEQEKYLQIVGEANNGKDLIEMTAARKPHVVITDIEMPVMNGIEATKELKKIFPSLGIIALTMFGDDRLIVDMLEAGADGYLLKSTSKQELIEACLAAAEGHAYFCNKTSFRLSQLIAASKKNLSGNVKAERFTEKEIEVIKLICQEYATKEIAELSRLTKATVDTYRGVIMEKIGAKNVVGVVVYAIKNGIFKIA